mmetsp:Transcript_21913/g.45633  ORF Transcript_21913/g.45633 Transcript_21913/m.45633 type:complete len:752 (+) Transcript_21913:158-2413(+)
MEGEYEMPVDFGDRPVINRTGGDATSASSLASSSKVASAASAPVNVGTRKRTTAGELFGGGGSLGSLTGRPSVGRRVAEDICTYTRFVQSTENSIKGEGEGNSFHSSPLAWNTTPQRKKAMREMERKIRHRNVTRAVQNQRPFSSNFPIDPDGKDDGTKDTNQPELVLPKALTDIFLQTALLGIDTTAKLSKPTLALTRNTLLPQLFIPLLKEVWEQYAPARLQTWFKVVPSYLKNLGAVVWDTEPGKELGEKWNRLADNLVDMASSEVSRQCWIDFTVCLIKILECLHTPEFKALLDQSAVGMCRFVDVLSSGKAKQVWFDIGDTLWALVEVGNDPLVVTSLAEGCAQICFALENERDSLKSRRLNDGTAATGRRKVRDRRQMETYPPGKVVVVEGGGEETVKKAFLSSLGGCLDEQDNVCNDEEKMQLHDDGPPKLITPKSPIDTAPNVKNFDKTQHEVKSNNEDDDQSEITTDVEDLQFQKGSDKSSEPVGNKRKQIEYNSFSRNASNQPLAFRDDNNDGLIRNFEEVPEWQQEERDDDEVFDTFDESILQFYRRLNQVLSETRKEKMTERALKRTGDLKQSTQATGNSDGRVSMTPNTSYRANTRYPTTVTKEMMSTLPLKISKNRWKIIIVSVAGGIASMCMLWFALGCYGFYILFISGRHSLSTVQSKIPLSASEIQQPQNQPNIIIQIVAKTQEKSASHNSVLLGNNESEIKGRSSEVANSAIDLSIEAWKQLNDDIDAALGEL